MHAVGLRTHIWNNAAASVLLLAGFPVLILAIFYAFALVFGAFDATSVSDGLAQGLRLLPQLLPWAVGAAVLWFAVAWFMHQRIIDAVTGARPVTRAAEPRLYDLLENLCISRGLTMPTLRVIETDARNAFASGIHRGRYSVTVTRGLVDALDDAELEAVLAHELTHIRNGDVRLLVIAAIFVGVVSLVGDLLLRLFSWFGNGSSGGWIPRRRSSERDEKGSGFVFLVLLLIAVVIFFVARFLAIVLRLSLSRRREYMANAGAVELTKNPDAMISALRKVEGRSEVAGVPAQIREMFLDNPSGSWFESLFATHPSIARRVDALVRFAGGHDAAPEPPPEPARTTSVLPAGTSFLHPEGAPLWNGSWPDPAQSPARPTEP